MDTTSYYEKCPTSEIIDTEEILSKRKKPNQQNHNLLLTKLTEFLIHVDSLNKQGKQINNEDINEYIISDMEVNLTIQRIESYKLAHPEKFNDPKNFDLSSIYFHINRWNLIKGFVLCVSTSIVGSGGILILDVITDSLKDYQGETKKK